MQFSEYMVFDARDNGLKYVPSIEKIRFVLPGRERQEPALVTYFPEQGYKKIFFLANELIEESGTLLLHYHYDGISVRPVIPVYLNFQISDFAIGDFVKIFGEPQIVKDKQIVSASAEVAASIPVEIASEEFFKVFCQDAKISWVIKSKNQPQLEIQAGTAIVNAHIGNMNS